MAEKLDSYEFPVHGNTRYPWSEWFDGSIWRLHQGVDFNSRPQSFANTATSRARARGGRLRVAVDNLTVILQFVPEEVGHGGNGTA